MNKVLNLIYPRFFLNADTCEATRSRHLAKSWLKSGSDVEIWFNGTRTKTWEAA